MHGTSGLSFARHCHGDLLHVHSSIQLGILIGLVYCYVFWRLLVYRILIFVYFLLGENSYYLQQWNLDSDLHLIDLFILVASNCTGYKT